MLTPTVDGTLLNWADVEPREEWGILLLGNGLSINVWPRFAYRSLFDYARTGGGLTASDLALFQNTPNFERVLGDLGTAIRVAETIGTSTTRFYERYRRIQRALGHAIRQVHLNRTAVSDDALAAIRTELLNYEWIFTTSYDLIVYWAMGRGPNGRYEPFMDHFRWRNRCEFDPDRAEVPAGKIPVYFLHGALHLVVGGTGATWKLTRNFQTLLDQFGQPIPGDPHARPLLVTEGSATEKLAIIQSNDYLRHGLTRLRERDLPLVVFGSSLSAQDDHLVDAINEHPERPVAVSMYPRTTRENATVQADIFGRLQTDNLLFFDSTTHPLGAASLQAP